MRTINIRWVSTCVASAAMLSVMAGPGGQPAALGDSGTLYLWVAPVDGAFSDPARWAPPGPPGPDDTALFAVGGDYRISFLDDAQTRHVRVSADPVTFDLDGFTYSMDDLGVSSLAGDSGELRVGDGALDAGLAIHVGGSDSGPGGDGMLWLESGATVRTGGILKIWDGGVVEHHGELLAASAIEVSGGELSHWAGAMEVSSNGPTLLPSDGLFIGTGGASGSMSITNGARVSTLYTPALLGADAGSAGTVLISGSGSRWSQLLTMMIGHSGSGTVAVEDGGAFATDVVRLGMEAGSTGLVTLSGSGSSWGTTTMEIGVRGNGTVLVQDGAAVAAGPGIPRLAVHEGSVAAVTVSGAGSRWNGDLAVGIGGEAALLVEAGGKVKASWFSVASESASSGSVTVTGSGSALESLLILVADAGTGSLTVDDGGQVTARHDLLIGSGATGSGTVIVQGAGSAVDVSGEFGGAIFVGGDDRGPGGVGVLSVSDGGVVSTDTFMRIWETGELRGDGTIQGEVRNDGAVSPGTSAGILTIDGDYHQQSNGRLLIDLGGTDPGAGEHNQLAVTGHAALDGIVQVQLAEGYAPNHLDAFTILTFASRSGMFSDFEGIGLADDMVLVPVYTANNVKLVAAIPGDANLDGRVDGEDFLIWQAGFGSPSGAAWGDGDFNGDGRVDGEDFLIWQASFGSTASSLWTEASGSVPPPIGSVTGVSAITPEPAAAGLLLVIGGAMLGRQRSLRA